MHVIGTAGHVDHGKSTLIRALTGIDPDRLPEEKERGMTIDLGFAWITLPSGREVGIVDVPGHERFVRNMLAGVGGIDLALLVIAADEGVMPQTREHLAILNLLKTKRALVAVTKSDLVDKEFLDLAKVETEEVLEGTIFDGAPMIDVSAHTGAGLDELKQEIDRMLAETPPRQDLGRPRLAVDRAFTVAGFGTVVTGTLIDGHPNPGSRGRAAPGRPLLPHSRPPEPSRQGGSRRSWPTPGRQPLRRLSRRSAPWRCPDQPRLAYVHQPGERQGQADRRRAPAPEAQRQGGFPRPGQRDPRPRPPAGHPANSSPATKPGAQIHLADPVPLVKGDFFVIRDTETTLGGGQVVDTSARRHRPFVASVLERLEAMEQGSLDQMLLGAIDQWGPCDIATLAQRSNQTLSQVQPVVEQLSSEGSLVLLGGLQARPEASAYSRPAWRLLTSKATAALTEYHAQFPLRKGISREELRSRLALSAALFTQVLDRMVTDGTLSDDGAQVRLPHHAAALTPPQQKQVDEYLASLEAEPYSRAHGRRPAAGPPGPPRGPGQGGQGKRRPGLRLHGLRQDGLRRHRVYSGERQDHRRRCPHPFQL